MKFILDKQRIALSFLGVLGMGFFLSFLILCNLGTDPYTFMNVSVAARVGLSLGNWQLLLNLVFFVLVFVLRRSLIGFGTVFNMVLVGYFADFFSWCWKKVFPASVFTNSFSRWSIFFIALASFVVSVAVYINANMGVSPYDALPLIITDKVRGRFPGVPAFFLRMLWDGAAILVGMSVGGVPIIGIILIALFLGPVISMVGKQFEKIFHFDE